MKRPIIWANIFLAAGILLGQFNAWLTVLFLLPAAGLCLCLGLKYQYRPCVLFLLFAAAGFLRSQGSWDDPMKGKPVAVNGARGTVIERGLTASGNSKLTVETDYGRITVYAMNGAAGADIGRQILFSGELLPLELPSAPGGYNEFLHLRSKKINAKIFVYGVKILNAEENPRGENFYTRLLIFLRGTRDRLAAVYDEAFPEKEAGIMKSLLLGDKSGLDEDSEKLYRDSGIYHLLCISGLHTGIFMLAIGRLFKIFLNERYAWLAALAVLILYALLTGASVSTVRAVIMGGVFVFSKFFFRDYDLLASTGTACIILLLYEPLYLYEAGFQLSFGAVFGIASLTQPVGRGISLTLKRLPFKNTLAAGIAATLATYPVLMYHFNEISVYGILVNLFVIPTSTVLVVSGLLVGLAGLIFLPAALFSAGVSFYLLKFYDAVCNFFSGLPFAVISTGRVSVLTCAFIYAAVGFFAAALNKFKIPAKPVR